MLSIGIHDPALIVCRKTFSSQDATGGKDTVGGKLAGTREGVALICVVFWVYLLGGRDVLSKTLATNKLLSI